MVNKVGPTLQDSHEGQDVATVKVMVQVVSAKSYAFVFYQGFLGFIQILATIVLAKTKNGESMQPGPPPTSQPWSTVVLETLALSRMSW